MQTMARWRKHFSQILNVHGVNDVRQTEIHTAEPPVPEPSAFEVETAIENIKRYISPSIYQIPADFIKGAGQVVLRSVSMVLVFGIRRNCLKNGRSR